MQRKKYKILVIVGPTSSGKSDLAVKLAKKFNGEVISADSRQVYKGLNIGSGKITKREMRGVPHHLLSIANPKRIFSVVDFQKRAYVKINEIIKRKKLPIICGGTGFYIQSIVDGLVLPNTSRDSALRKRLLLHSTEELCKILKKLDPKKFKSIDRKNKVRLIRAIELAQKNGKVPPLKNKPLFDATQLGIYWPREMLRDRIKKRLLKRLRSGMAAEVKKLNENGLSWKRLSDLGLEYKYISLYLNGKLTKSEMVEELSTKIYQFSKRQMTWFKRDSRIVWLAGDEGIGRSRGYFFRPSDSKISHSLDPHSGRPFDSLRSLRGFAGPQFDSLSPLK